jgi:hypothetical protein
LAPVVGQVSCADYPASEMAVFFEPVDSKQLYASGRVLPDGSFRHLYTNGCPEYEGVMPGRYRVFFSPINPAKPRPPIDRKYLGPGTSDLLVNVERDWNCVSFSLPMITNSPRPQSEAVDGSKGSLIASRGS